MTFVHVKLPEAVAKDLRGLLGRVRFEMETDSGEDEAIEAACEQLPRRDVRRVSMNAVAKKGA